MKNLKVLFVSISIICTFFAIGGKTVFSQNNTPDNPFVYMREGEFFYKGDEFFLKNCNYLISTHINESGEYIVGPHYNYFKSHWGTGPIYPNTQDEASGYIRAHFKILKDNGFNSVRIMNCQVEPRCDVNDREILTTRLWFRYHKTQTNPDPAKEFKDLRKRDYEILYDLETGNGTEYYKEAMRIVLDIAEEYDLKIIWVLGRDSQFVYADNPGDEHLITVYRSLLTEPGSQLNSQFSTFLNEVANEFKNHKALMCYDLFNENGTYRNEGKVDDYYELSETFKGFINILKTNDPNHFTTVGFTSLRQFFNLGVEPFKHCDVYSFHIYGSNLVNMSSEDFVNWQQVYLCSTLSNSDDPHPWMIGETGEQSLGDTSESMQRDFARETALMSKACNSIGYSWWEFHDPGWAEYGLLKRDGVTPVEIKTNPSETINVFGSTKTIIDPNRESFFVEMENSTKKCELKSLNKGVFSDNLGDAETKTWRGLVVDGQNNAIANALVKISLNFDSNTEDDVGGSLTDFYISTKSDGSFSITLPILSDKVAKISVTKYGYDIDSKARVFACWKNPFSKNWNSFSNKFKLHQSDFPETLNIPTTDIEVSKGTTLIFEKSTMIAKNIYVKAGGELIVREIITFGEDNGIFVEPGGKLLLDNNATITATHQKWKGIEITGENNKPAEIYALQNVTIAKAETGIDSRNNTLINIDGIRFVENNIAINIHDYGKPVTFNEVDFINNKEDLILDDNK